MADISERELTVAHAARQMLLERQHLDPAEAIRILTPLQAQDSPAPFVALAARLASFSRAALESAIEARQVVKTSIMRLTLHLAAADDYPAYAQLSRQARMRAWRKSYRHLDETRVIADLTEWFAEPRTNNEIRERVRRYDGVADDPWSAVMFARTLLPLVQVPPAGFWKSEREMRFLADPRPLPDPAEAAAITVSRYLTAFGPASRRDVAGWSGVAQRDLAAAWERLETVTFRDEKGVELLDLPGGLLPASSTKLPVRFLARWDQSLLAYADRDRILPPELQPLRLTLSGDQTVTVDGRVAASWQLERARHSVNVIITPHRPIPRSAHEEIRVEGERAARLAVPDVERVTITGL